MVAQRLCAAGLATWDKGDRQCFMQRFTRCCDSGLEAQRGLDALGGTVVQISQWLDQLEKSSLWLPAPASPSR